MKTLAKFLCAAAATVLIHYGAPNAPGPRQVCDVYCGDATCQDWGCSLAGCEVPGNGCRENEGNCPEDCFGR